jgi:hypothetical protein
MFALVENNQFVKTVSSSKGIELNGVQYPKTIFTLWTEAERNAIGLYEINVNSENKKDEAYYINTNITYSFNGGTVTGSYGTSTAKPLTNILFTEEDEIPSDKVVGDIKQYGLKEQKISIIKKQAASLLTTTDWHVVKAAEVAEYSVPTDISTYRAAVRTASNDMETKINAVADVDALKTLYEYTEQEDGTFTRPLGEFPEEIE